ncbi:putative bifunctional diguanylate cyclase/phosphodiesterase [Alkalicoccus urumqiensis]|nr:EAL domain-containing protein [Alkalicoccus urumqiensis]
MVLLLTAVLCLGGVIVVEGVGSPMLLEEAKENDARVLEENVGRTANFLELEEEALHRQLIDWSEWNETHDFIRNENDDYIDMNLEEEMLENIRVQHAAFFDESGALYYETGLPGSGTAEAILRQHEEEGDPVVIHAAEDGMMMAAVHPITRNDGSDPAGMMIMSRMLDETYIENLGELLSIDIAAESAARGDAVAASDRISRTYRLQTQDAGQPLELSIAGNQTIYNSQLEHLQQLKQTAGIVFLGVLLLVLLLTRKYVVRPISQVALQLQDVQLDQRRGTRTRIHVPSRLIETQDLEKEINSMLEKLQKSHEEITELAYHDQLTGLGNRFYLTHTFTDFTAKHGKAALFYFDLDGFKQVNDTWGHETGDLLLQEAARRIRAFFDGEEAMLARVGGDEFVVVTQAAPVDRLKQTGALLVDVVSREYRFGSVVTSVTASVGVASYPADAEALSQLLQAADQAMYEAKQTGKARAAVYAEMELADGFTRRETLKRDLVKALSRGELRLVYQPIYESGRKVQGAEALLRWRHPVYGEVFPNQFIPLMEESGVIHEAGRWVLRESAGQLKRWQEQERPDLYVSMNVSKAQLSEYRSFLTVLDEVLSETGVSPKKLQMEITESEVHYDDSDLVTFIEEVSRRGVRTALDDFGKGTASLYGLRHLPVDVVKMDRSFMENIPYDAFNASVLVGINSLLQELDVHVTAEGIENDEQYHFLLKHGITSMQGYYFSRPLETADMEAVLQKGQPALDA